MENREFALALENDDLQSLSKEELALIEGGFIQPFLAIAAIATAVVAIYDAGKAAGEFIYYATH
jgi:lactobin A/cerein 7B family class IIb bacteriocin